MGLQVLRWQQRVERAMHTDIDQLDVTSGKRQRVHTATFLSLLLCHTRTVLQAKCIVEPCSACMSTLKLLWYYAVRVRVPSSYCGTMRTLSPVL
jgi:hypothetical protein